MDATQIVVLSAAKDLATRLEILRRLRLLRMTHRGFTLIELSIVLVIIGLIVGGVLVGQDLIRAAEVRAQLTQIEKYNSAVNTFKSKFNAIPGDMRPEIASQFGFAVGNGCGGTLQGLRNGDGLIDGYHGSNLLAQLLDETGLFWQDFSSSAAGNLIEGQFPANGWATITCTGNGPNLSGTTVGAYFPSAKIGHANYIYVYETSGANWFAVSAVTSVVSSAVISNANIPVTQAYKMDLKVDDGLPTSGNVQAVYINGSNSVTMNAPNTTTSGGNSTSCYDTTTGSYSITYNNGNSGNCALSFKMQGGGP